ncbi:MAG: DUF1616 domain-containing protein [Roseiflexaceae bacterium]
MSRKSLDLALVCALALAALALTLLGVNSPALGLLLGLPLALVLPGYALTAALFPRRTLGGADRALFTLSLSLSIAILCGFVLNRTSWGLRPESWAVALSDVALGGSLIAFARRQLLPARSASVARDEQAHTAPSETATRPRLSLSIGQSVLFGLAIAVIAVAMLLARSEAALRPAPDVVQLWMLPSDTAEPHTLRVGLNSVGPAAGDFRLQIERGGYIIREWPSLIITPGQRWEETLTVQGRQLGSGPFEARLYRAEEPNVIYRRVALWFDTPQ